MKFEIIKKSKEGVLENTSMKLLKEKELKVAAYIRVSTELEEQNNSFSSQYKHFYKIIENNPNWSFAGIYAEKGKSGTKSENRKQLIQMLSSALDGNINLILTKSISRFARNTIDTLKYVRMLKENGIGVYFEEENINTLDMRGELLLTILSSIAQQESQNLSSHIKHSINMRRIKGNYLGTHRLYGLIYIPEKNMFEIIEEEAEIVKEIFERFDNGELITDICKSLNERKIPKIGGKEGTWRYNNLHDILSNEKYCGNLLLGKTYTPDPMTHKSYDNKGEEDMYFVRGCHKAIISEDLFNKVNEKLKNKHTEYKNRYIKDNSYEYFKNKIYCSVCGNKKQRYNTNNIKYAAYGCSKLILHGRKECINSFSIRSEDLEKFSMKTFKELKDFLKQNKLIEYENIENILNKYEITNKFNGELFSSLIKKVIVSEFYKGIITIKYILNDYLIEDKRKKNDEVYNTAFKTDLKYRVNSKDYKSKYMNLKRVIVEVSFEEDSPWKL